MNQESTPPWERSDGAREHLEQELRSTGVPFESLVATDARRFAATHSGEVLVEATRLVYGQPDVGEALREIDQSVTLYQEIEVGGIFGVQLNMQVLIECKTRVGLHAFGFPIPVAGRHTTPLVLSSDLARSRALRRVASYRIDDIPQHQSDVALLVDSKESGSFKKTDENLMYKAASSLIDYVTLDSSHYHADDSEQVLEQIGILPAFSEYVGAHNYWAPGVAERWIEENVDRYADEFTDAYFDGVVVYQMVSVYCPVVCLDANLYEVELGPDGDIESILPVDQLLTGVRPSGWPHALRLRAPWIGPEAAISVVSRDGLGRLMLGVHEWFVQVAEKLADISSDRAKHVLLESAFLNAVQRRHADNGRLYRSDLGYL